MKEKKIGQESSFIIKAVSDHWKNFTYDERYLDALANIFAFTSTCTAVTYFTDTNKFYLSYNSSLAKKNQSFFKLMLAVLAGLDKEELLHLYISHRHC